MLLSIDLQGDKIFQSQQMVYKKNNSEKKMVTVSPKPSIKSLSKQELQNSKRVPKKSTIKVSDNKVLIKRDNVKKRTSTANKVNKSKEKPFIVPKLKVSN